MKNLIKAARKKYYKEYVRTGSLRTDLILYHYILPAVRPIMQKSKSSLKETSSLHFYHLVPTPISMRVSVGNGIEVKCK